MRSHTLVLTDVWLYDEHRKGVDKIKALEQENERLKKELEGTYSKGWDNGREAAKSEAIINAQIGSENRVNEAYNKGWNNGAESCAAENKELRKNVQELRAAIKNHKVMTLHEFGESLAVADNHLWQILSTFDKCKE